jgi:hypothetical protein
MTTASIRTIQHRTHGVERLAVTLGLALVRWGQVHAERTAIAPDEHARRITLQRALAERDRATHRYGIAA